MAARTGTGDVVALSVHGPGGVVDLVVPSMATAADVAQEYAAQVGLPVVPALGTTTGLALQPALPLADAGSLLLATHCAGERLSAGHGAPVRLVAPGRRGYWWVKWVARVEVVDAPWWLQPPVPLQ